MNLTPDKIREALQAQLEAAVRGRTLRDVTELNGVLKTIPDEHRMAAHMVMCIAFDLGQRQGGKFGQSAALTAAGVTTMSPNSMQMVTQARQMVSELCDFGEDIFMDVATGFLKASMPNKSKDDFDNELKALFKTVTGEDLDTKEN